MNCPVAARETRECIFTYSYLNRASIAGTFIENVSELSDESSAARLSLVMLGSTL